MTLPSSGQIAVSDVNNELGIGTTYGSSLSFLNGYMKSPANPPNLAAFYGMTYFQNNNQGNCNNGNCATSGGPNGNCTSNCNCGNKQCTNCYISGTSDCSNCSNCNAINCSNCDSRPYLQPNCNCNCTYNCTTNAVSYNCTTGQVSYNCNCDCNCSKIVCGKLHDLGMMSHNVWAADQAYGRLLRATDKDIYRGYIRWARPVTQWMDTRGSDFMLWVNKEQRKKEQAKMMIALTHKVGSPWSEHMAYLMGAIKNDNEHGRLLMKIGRFFCKSVNYIPKVPTKYKKSKWLIPYSLLSSYTIWFLLEFSYYTTLTYLKAKQAFDVLIHKEVKEY